MENKALLRGIQNNDLASIKHQASSMVQQAKDCCTSQKKGNVIFRRRLHHFLAQTVTVRRNPDILFSVAAFIIIDQAQYSMHRSEMRA
jgi:hypothetical protein